MAHENTSSTLYALRRRSSLSLDRSGGANRADAAATDIKTIMAQWKHHGTMPAIQLSNPLYGDHTGPDNLHDTWLAVQAAQDRFNLLPMSVRNVAHTPQGFLDLLDTEDGRQRLVDAGLQIIPETTSAPAPSPSLDAQPKSQSAPSIEPSISSPTQEPADS